MKNWILIILIGIIFVRCDDSLEISKENLKGSWYSCIKNDGYSEHHFKDKQFEYYSESFDKFDEYLCGYYLSNDTIFYYSMKNKDYNNFHIIKSISENNIILKTESNEINLSRIPDVVEEKKRTNNIKELEKINDAFYKKVRERKEKYNCQYNYIHQGEEGILVLEEDSID